MNIKTLLILLLLAAGALFYFGQKQKADRLNFAYLEEVAKNAKLVEEFDGVTSKLTAAVATEKALEAQLGTTNSQLARLVKARNEKVMEYNNLKLAFDSLKVDYATTSSFDSAGACIVPIDTTIGKVSLDGFTRCDSTGGFVSLKSQISPIRLQLFKTKAKSGLWRFYVNTGEDSSFVKVDSLEIMFTEPKPSFLQKNAAKIGIVAAILTYFLLK